MAQQLADQSHSCAVCVVAITIRTTETAAAAAIGTGIATGISTAAIAAASSTAIAASRAAFATSGLRLRSCRSKRVLLRKACLDAYLDGNLWLPDEAEAEQHAASPIARAQSGSSSRGWLPCAS